MPKLSPPKPKAKPKSGGGGGGGAGAGEPPRDRIFNQDDLAGVLIGLVLLLLLALYLLRGGAAGGDNVVNTQSLAVEPVTEPVGPPPDPFGNQAVDLTPKSPLPPEPAVVQAEPAPAPTAAPAPAAVEVKLHAYFCTAKSELTPASLAALDRQIFELRSQLSGKELVVTGYADTRGESAYNTWLGGERANAVAGYLVAKGIKATASAVGELPDLTDNENCPNQRRVDVRLSDGPAEAPSRSCTPPQELAELVCD
jgi:outer membrane protein OmpA-like peptidoglycan-associated protein